MDAATARRLAFEPPDALHDEPLHPLMHIAMHDSTHAAKPTLKLDSQEPP